MTECARCGDCCEVIPVDVRRFHRGGDSTTSTLWTYVGFPDPRDDDLWKSEWTKWKDKDRPLAIRNWLDANFIRKNWVSIGDGDCTCIMFNSETRLCMAHDDRPPICSSYPWYGGEPGAPLISNRCSFWADVPKDQWHEGVKPMKVRLRSGRG